MLSLCSYISMFCPPVAISIVLSPEVLLWGIVSRVQKRKKGN